MSNTKSGGLFSFLLKDRIVAPKNFNRWRIPPASIAIHLCIGLTSEEATSCHEIAERLYLKGKKSYES